MKRGQAVAAKLIKAAQAGDLHQVQTLLSSGDSLTQDGIGNMDDVTPLMVAAAGGHEATVELLLESGADPAQRDRRGHSAAFYARAAGHPHLAERLDTVVDQEKTLR